MFEKALNRIMEGARTPEGKVIAIMLTLSLALMTWNTASIQFAFAQGEGSVSAQAADSDKDAKGSTASSKESASKDAEASKDSEKSANKDADAGKDAAGDANKDSGKDANAAKGDDVAKDEAAKDNAAKDNDADAAAAGANATAGVDADAPAGESSDTAAATGSDASDDKTAAETPDATATDTTDDKKKTDDADEETYPAVTLNGNLNDMAVAIDAPEGALPEGAKLSVSSVSLTDEELIEKVEAKSGKTAKQIKALKIVLANAKGKAIQPKADVTVKFDNDGLEGDEFVVYRINDDGSIAKVNTAVPATATQQVFTTSKLKSYVVAGLVEKATDDEENPDVAQSDGNAEEGSEESDNQDSDSQDSESQEADSQEADNQETENAETEESEELPAQAFLGAANGVTANVVAPKGAFPAGTTMEVAGVAEEDVMGAVKAALEDGAVVKNVAAVDITFKDAEGKEIEPRIPISVSLRSSVVMTAKEPAVVHIPNNGAASVVSERKATVDSMAFTSNDFSVYVVVDTGDDARLLVKFMNGTTEIASMYVKEDDNMEQVLYDPGAGELGEGVYFRGWTTDANYTTDTQALTIADVRTAVSGMLPPGSDGTEVTYYAMLFKDYRITYYDENSISLGQEELTFRADATSAEQSYTVNMGYTVPDDTHHFEGWNVVEGGSNISGYTSGDIYQNNDVITITGDVKFGVNAPEGHWFIFNENGSGATYNAPQFVYSSEKPTRPDDANMVRNGYTFGGWFTDKSVADQTSGGTQYDFDQTLSDKVTVYARWIPNTTANYTVLIWKQNLAADGYDFKESISLSGTVGSTVNTVSQHGNGDNAYARIDGTNYRYTGFHLGSYDQNVTINTEGNSVVNVYYDRTEYTLTFQGQGYTYTQTTGNQGEQYGLVDGEYVRVYRDSGQWWYYDWGWQSYTGTRYTRSWGTVTYKTITALYGQSIGENFPITDNGASSEWRWDPRSSSGGSGSETFSNVLVYIDIMPAENVTFVVSTSNESNKYMEFYVEALPGQTADRTWDGKSFVKYGNTITARYGYFTEAEDFLDLTGYTKYGSDPAFNDGRANVSAGGTIYFYYTRNAYTINFMDGVYVDGNNNINPGLLIVGS